MVGQNENFMNNMSGGRPSNGSNKIIRTLKESVTMLSETFQDAIYSIANNMTRESKKRGKLLEGTLVSNFSNVTKQFTLSREEDDSRDKRNQLYQERLTEDTRSWQEVFFGSWFRRNNKNEDRRNEELRNKLSKVNEGIRDIGIGSALSNLSNNTTSSFERQIEHIKEIRTELGLTGKQWNQLESMIDEKVYNPLNREFGYIFSQEDKLNSINDTVEMGVRDQQEMLKLMPYLLKWQKLGGDMTADDLEFMRPVLGKMGEGALETIGDTAAKLSQDFGISFKDLLTSLNTEKMYNEIMMNSNGNAEVFKKSAKSFMGAVTLMGESYINPEHMISLLTDLSKKSIADLNDSGITQQLALAGLSVQELKDQVKSGDFMGATNAIIQGLGEYVEQNPDMAENIAGILGYDVDFLNELALYHDDANESFGKINKSINESEGTLNSRLKDLPVSMVERVGNWFESLPFVRSVIKFIQQFEIGLDDIFYAMGIIKLLPEKLVTGAATLGKEIVKGFGSFVDDLISGIGSFFRKLNPFSKSVSAPAGAKGSSLTKNLLTSSDDVAKSGTKLLTSGDDILKGMDPSKFIDASYTVVDDVAKVSDDVLTSVGKVAGQSVDDVAKSASFLGKAGKSIGKWLGPLGVLLGAGVSAKNIAKADDKKQAIAKEAGGWLGGMAAGAGAGAIGGSVGGPIGTAIGTVIGGIAGAIGGEKVAEWLYDNFDKIKAGVADVGKWIGSKFSDAWNYVKEVSSNVATWIDTNVVQPIKDFFSPIVDWFVNSVWTPIKNFAQDAFYFVVGLGVTAWEGIESVWSTVSTWFMDNIWTPLSEAASATVQWFSDKFTEAWTWISTTWSAVTQWFTDNIWTPLSSAVDSVRQWISDKFTEAWTWVSTTWSVVTQWFQDTIWTPITTAVDWLKTTISTAFSNAWEGVKGAWSVVTQWFQDTIWSPISSAVSTVWEAIEGTISGVVSGFQSAWEGVASWFSRTVLSPIQSAWDATFGAISRGFETVKGWVGGVIEKGKNFISGSHRTGLAYAPFDNYTAELHQGEVIRSLDGSTSAKVPYDGFVTDLNRGDQVLTAANVRSMERQVSDTSASLPYMDPGMGATSIELMNNYFDEVAKHIKVSVTKEVDSDSSSGSGEVPANSSSSALVNAARTFKGAKYVWGGKDYPSLDCSGLVSSAFEKVGLVDSKYKYNNNAQAIRSQSSALSASSAGEGDLAFLVEGGEATHIGIISGKGSNGRHTVIHSSTGYGGYAEESNSTYWNAWGRFGKSASKSNSNNTPKTTVGNPKGNASQVSFIKSLAPGAIKSRADGSTLPSVTMSQGILESGWGKSALAIKAKNLFGIKTGSSWTGAYVDMPTTEYSNGVPYSTTARFRAYDSFSDSIEDHGKLLKNNARYSGVISSKSYKQATQALKDAGYATDPNYPSLLNSVIEDYNLSSYDDATLADTSLSSTESSGVDPKAPSVTVNIENKELVKTLRWQVAELTKAYANSSKTPSTSRARQSKEVASIFNFT